MSGGITPGQLRALQRPASLHDRYPDYRGFRSRFLGNSTSVLLRAIGSTGLVALERLGDGAFRYSLTPAGRARAQGGAS